MKISSYRKLSKYSVDCTKFSENFVKKYEYFLLTIYELFVIM